MFPKLTTSLVLASVLGAAAVLAFQAAEQKLALYVIATGTFCSKHY